MAKVSVDEGIEEILAGLQSRHPGQTEFIQARIIIILVYIYYLIRILKDYMIDFEFRLWLSNRSIDFIFVLIFTD